MTVINTTQLTKEIEALISKPLNLIDEERARELLQEFFDASLIQPNPEGMKSAFTLFYKINCLTKKPEMRINFNELISALSFCYDLIFAESEKRILFISYDEPTIEVCAEPERISLCILNIIFHIVELFNSRYYFISLYSDSKNAVIKIDFDAFCGYDCSLFSTCGADYIYSLGGRMLYYGNDESSSVIISVLKGDNKNLPEYQTPEIEDLLFNRLSVIYSSLF